MREGVLLAVGIGTGAVASSFMRRDEGTGAERQYFTTSLTISSPMLPVAAICAHPGRIRPLMWSLAASNDSGAQPETALIDANPTRPSCGRCP
eukprot:COSAG03_NODE_10575_length_642_cov_1.101289_1_plen_92_part_01